MRVFKNLFSQNDKIHGSEVVVGDMNNYITLEELPEIITNSNGTAVKFPSGFMICLAPTLTLRYSNGFLLDAPWTFPEAFIKVPNVLPNTRLPSNRSRDIAYQIPFSLVADGRSANIRIQNTSGNWGTGDTCVANPVAFGFWK